MYKDSRGYLIFPIKDNKYMNKITPNTSKDCTYSVNKKYVFRGLHINTFGKLITCISGHFIDIMVNMQTLKVDYYDIKPGDQIYCPGNYAHGFISLEENSVLSYHCEGYFGSEVGGLLNYKDPILNIKLPEYINESDIIINEKDSTAPFLEFDYFILGSKGYIGSNVLKELQKQNKKVYAINYRMEQLKEIKKLIEFYKPKYLINCAGLTGTPNTSWCNTHQKETLMTNVINQINILNLCNQYSVHCTLIGSAMIFKQTGKDGSTESTGNPEKCIKYSNDKGDICDLNENVDTETNYYSKCRLILEEQVKPFDNYMLLRINYPLNNDLNNPKNLISKLLKYEEIEDLSLSVTNLDSLCPIIPQMIENNETGIINFVNDEQINLIDLILLTKQKLNLNINKKFVESKRESITIVPDRLKKYNVENIKTSLNKLFSKL